MSGRSPRNLPWHVLRRAYDQNYIVEEIINLSFLTGKQGLAVKRLILRLQKEISPGRTLTAAVKEHGICLAGSFSEHG